MTTTYTGFNEDILLADGLAAMKNRLAPMKAFSTAIDLSGKRKDDTVLVPIHGAASAATRTLGSDGESGGASTVASVKLGSPFYSQWEAVDGRDRMEDFMARGVESFFAVSQAVLDAALAYITAANYGDVADTDKLVVPLAEFGFADIAKLNSLATTKKISERDRVMILNGLYTWQFLGDAQGALIIATAGDKGIITGKLPPIGVASAYTYAGLPSNDENLAGLVCDPSCLAVGMAPVLAVSNDIPRNAIEQVVKDEEAGVVMSYRRWREEGKGKMVGRVEVMAGFAKCNDAVIRLLSA